MDRAERTDQGNSAAHADVCSRLLGIAVQIESAVDNAAAVHLLQQGTAALDADAAVFISFVRDDVTLASYRYLLACDPVWALQYAQNGWCLDDPWLRYALYNAAPIRAEELPPLNDRERWVVDGAAHFGFVSTLIVPVPSPAAQSRVAVLCLGSAQRQHFVGEGYGRIRLLARSLAMELGDWMHRQVRADLMAQARITEDDLVLLWHQQQGHNSKVIATLMKTEAKTIDCRFQRLSLKLGAANRRAALRVAEIYGLI